MIIIKGQKESIRNDSSCGLDGDDVGGTNICGGSWSH